MYYTVSWDKIKISKISFYWETRLGYKLSSTHMFDHSFKLFVFSVVLWKSRNSLVCLSVLGIWSYRGWGKDLFQLKAQWSLWQPYICTFIYNSCEISEMSQKLYSYFDTVIDQWVLSGHSQIVRVVLLIGKMRAGRNCKSNKPHLFRSVRLNHLHHSKHSSLMLFQGKVPAFISSRFCWSECKNGLFFSFCGEKK